MMMNWFTSALYGNADIEHREQRFEPDTACHDEARGVDANRGTLVFGAMYAVVSVGVINARGSGLLEDLHAGCPQRRVKGAPG